MASPLPLSSRPPPQVGAYERVALWSSERLLVRPRRPPGGGPRRVPLAGALAGEAPARAPCRFCCSFRATRARRQPTPVLRPAASRTTTANKGGQGRGARDPPRTAALPPCSGARTADGWAPRPHPQESSSGTRRAGRAKAGALGTRRGPQPSHPAQGRGPQAGGRPGRTHRRARRAHGEQGGPRPGRSGPVEDRSPPTLLRGEDRRRVGAPAAPTGELVRHTASREGQGRGARDPSRTAALPPCSGARTAGGWAPRPHPQESSSGTRRAGRAKAGALGTRRGPQPSHPAQGRGPQAGGRPGRTRRRARQRREPRGRRVYARGWVFL